MKKNRVEILSLILIGVLVQGVCVYAASSTDYTQDELDNLTPGWKKDDINKSNYKVDSYKNTFSSQDNTDDDDDSSDDTATTPTFSTINTSAGNVIVSVSPSTGNSGDYWGRTADGKWILIENNVPAIGWRSVRGIWYYMDYEGVMQTGWLNYGQNWYYLNSDGSMAYNTYKDGYYLGYDGAME